MSRLLVALILLLVLAVTAPARAAEAVEPGSAPPPAPVLDVFPVGGAVDFGPFAARFGGGRGHQGQDVFAACGTPVVAVHAGRVVDNRYEGAAGNYLVVRTDQNRGHVYMHLRAPARPPVGAEVLAGEPIGRVGDTGDAWDCHLHFEVWTAPGWYRGGHPVDPLPLLRGLRG